MVNTGQGRWSRNNEKEGAGKRRSKANRRGEKMKACPLK